MAAKADAATVSCGILVKKAEPSVNTCSKVSHGSGMLKENSPSRMEVLPGHSGMAGQSPKYQFASGHLLALRRAGFPLRNLVNAGHSNNL